MSPTHFSGILGANTHIVQSGQSIQSVIDSIADASANNPYEVILPPGLREEQDISIPSHISIHLMAGAIVRLTTFNADGCIFKNKDDTGNEGIHIYGEGKIEGQRWNWVSGEQCGVIFKNCEDCSVKCYIGEFSCLEVKRDHCTNVYYENLDFTRRDKQRVRLMHFDDATLTAHGCTFTETGGATHSIEATAGPLGGSCLKVTVPKDGRCLIKDQYWRDNDKSFDLRFVKTTVWIKYLNDFDDADAYEIDGIVRLWGTATLAHKDKNVYIRYDRGLSREWTKFTCYSVLTAQNSSLSAIDKTMYDINGTLIGTYADPVEILIGDISIEPIDCDFTNGSFVFSFDDGHASWESIALILESYDFYGNFNSSPRRTGGVGDYDDLLPMFQRMHKAGHEFASHSLTHTVVPSNLEREVRGSKRLLEQSGLGPINFFAKPGGNSKWSGEMQNYLLKYYKGIVEATTGCQGAVSGKYGTFGYCAAFDGAGDLPADIKKAILNGINYHQPVRGYGHDYDSLDEARIISMCEFMHEYGIDVLRYSDVYNTLVADRQTSKEEPYKQTLALTGNKVFRPEDMPVMFVDPGANRNLTPSAVFQEGLVTTIINTADAAETITFDPTFTAAGNHDGANGAAILTDSGESWTINQLIGKTINNTTDGSSGTVTANTATTITAILSGGTDNDWDAADAYTITPVGLNQAIAQNERAILTFDGSGWFKVFVG